MSYLLSVNDVSYSYPNSDRAVFDGLDLRISAGEMVALIGPNGAGKTTLAMIIAGMLPPDRGTILLDGADIYDDGYVARPGEVGFLYQDPADGILTTSVEREIAFGPENACVPTAEIRRIVEKLSSAFGLERALKKVIEELSGGNIERCALAGAMSTNPRLLILDEPDSFLDFEGKRRFWREIDELRRAGTAVLYITQSRSGPSRADRIYRLVNGSFSSDNIFNDNKIDKIISNDILDKSLYRFKDIAFSYNNNEVLHGVNIEIRGGERVALLGASGSGKTTLARVCAGLYSPDKGEIDLPADGRIALSFQFPAKQLFAETVLEDVAFGPKNLGLTDPQALARRTLSRVGIDEELYDRSPFELSDGQQRWVGIAGALACEPRCIFFDEPTATLDARGRTLFRNIVSELSSEGRATVVITHDLELAAACASRAVALKGGAVAFDGPLSRILEDRELRASLGIGTESDLLGGL